MRSNTRMIEGVQNGRHWTPKLAAEQLRKKSALMCKYARGIIYVNDEGKVEKIETLPKRPGNYLVVISPVIINGEHVEQAVRLEISFGKSIPYEEFFWTYNNKKNAMRRRWYVPLQDFEAIELLPIICEVIQTLVDETIKEWNTVSFHKQIGKGTFREFFRGCFITLPDDPAVIAYTFLSQNRRSRDHMMLGSLARQVEYEFSGLKYANYSIKEIKRHPGAKHLAAKMKDKNNNWSYTREQIEVVRNRLGNPAKAKNRALFELMLDAFKIKFRTEKEMYESKLEALELTYGEEKKKLLRLCSLEIATHPKLDNERKKSLDGYMRVEVLPSKWLRLNHKLLKDEIPVSSIEMEES